MQRQTMLPAVILALLGLGGPALSSPTTQPAPTPPLGVPEKPSETEHRTLPKPGKPESEQPPPDAVGKVPKDLKEAGKKEETSKVLPQR